MTMSLRLRWIAGWALVVICGAHIALFAFTARNVAAGWLLGDFRGGTATIESEALFWALPGGFVIPMLTLAGLILWLARRGAVMPGFVGYGLTLWTLLNVVIVPASGFVAGLVPCALLVWADVADRAGRRSAVSAAPGSRPAAG